MTKERKPTTRIRVESSQMSDLTLFIVEALIDRGWDGEPPGALGQWWPQYFTLSEDDARKRIKEWHKIEWLRTRYIYPEQEVAA